MVAQRKNASHCHMNILRAGDQRSDGIRKLGEAGILAAPRGNEMKMPPAQQELDQHMGLIGGLFARVEELSR
jgi:hypothetical protein